MAAGSEPGTLRAARAVLKTLLVLNYVFAGLFILILGGSFIVAEQALSALAEHPRITDPRAVMVALRLVMVLGLVAVPLAHLIFTRLLAMVETVRAGDPFVRENARRFTTVAWALLGLQFLDLAFAAVSFGVAPDTEAFSWSFGLTGWIAVLMLFVLARVFHHGARLRDDLEGTV